MASADQHSARVTGPQPGYDRQAMGRIAASVWAAIAFFGVLGTAKSLRFPETHVSAMRVVVVLAALTAAIAFVLPWRRMPKILLTAMLVLMAFAISALAWASGAVQSQVVLAATFAIALAACFLPVKTSAAQIVFIAALLAAGLVVLDNENAGVDALRTTLLLSVLVVLCGLMLILRAIVEERHGELDLTAGWHDAGVLQQPQLERTLARELSRAQRHERTIAIVLVEVTGDPGDPDAAGPGRERLVQLLSDAILGRVRVEDDVAHLDGLRFAVLAPETGGEGAATIAEIVGDVVRDQLVELGYAESGFEIVHGWADYPHHAQTAAGLLESARADLDAAHVRSETRPRGAGHPAASTRPATAGRG